MHVGTDLATASGEKKKKVFHGWYIVVVSLLAHLAFSTSLSSTLGVFFKPMSEEFGWPRSFLSGVRSFETLFNGVIIAFMGPILDRHGARTVMIIGGIAGGFGLILLGQTNGSVQFFLVRGIIVCIGMAGISHMVSSVAISNWFIARRGRALGISGAGLSGGKVFLAPLITLMMGMWSWREAWAVLGLMVLVLVPIPAALLIRRRPEDMGLRPDGAAEPAGAGDATSSTIRSAVNPFAGEPVWTRREAMRTSALWLIILTFGVANIGSQGLALHTIPYLTDIGFSPALAAAALSILAVFQLTGTIAWGFVVERFPINHCSMVMFISEGIGVAMILWLRDPVLIILGLVAYGFALSGNIVLQDIIWANYFGRLSLGTVRSVGYPLIALFSAGGPLYFGYLYDVTGGYQLALMGFIVALIIASGLVLICRPPRKRDGLFEEATIAVRH